MRSLPCLGRRGVTSDPHSMPPLRGATQVIFSRRPISDLGWEDAYIALISMRLCHQGTVYPATPIAVPFIARLATGGALPATVRLSLCQTLLYLADRWAASLIDNADYAAATRREAQAAEWTRESRDSITAHIPALMATWHQQPPAIRYVLAGLAALYAEYGSPVAGEVIRMARAYAGTQQRAYLLLAETLLRADDDTALSLATDIVKWDEDADPAWLDVPETPALVRAGHVLAHGIEFARLVSETSSS